MKVVTIAALLLLVWGITMPAWAVEEQIPAEVGDKAPVVQANTAFALSLYAQFRSREGNLFFSPLSLSSALAMTYAGARGQTAEQMAAVLHFPADQKRLPQLFAGLTKDLQADRETQGYQLTVANALWGQQGYRFHDE